MAHRPPARVRVDAPGAAGLTALLGLATALSTCTAHLDPEASIVLTSPTDPAATIAVSPVMTRVCGSICDALVERYGVPQRLQADCVFECATGFEAAPDACYELVACVADRTLCDVGDVSPPCATRAADCLALWSLANGSCRGCWQPSRTVHGRQVVTYLSDGAASGLALPEDFSGLEIAALLPRQDGTFHRFPGRGERDGTYSIPGVPGCGVWIQVGATYTWSGNADVDTSYFYPGRRDATLGGAGTRLIFALDGLVPWTGTDWFELFVPQLSYYTRGALFGLVGGPIAPGATGWSWEIDAEGAALADASQGDSLYFTQLASETRSDGTIVRIVRRAATVEGFTATSGAATTLAVPLMEVAPTRSLTIDFRRSTFAALAADLHPASVPGFMDGAEADNPAVLDVWTHPGLPQVGATAELVLIDAPTTSGDIAPFEVAFGTPYPASWGIDVDARITYHVRLADRRGVAFNGVAYLESMAPLDRVGGPTSARLGPPRNLRVNGREAWTAQDGGTLTPTVAWDPPRVGMPALYGVEVRELVDPALTSLRGRVVATFLIPALEPGGAPALTSFTLPGGVLTRGADYGFTVFAATDRADALRDTASNTTSEYRP